MIKVTIGPAAGPRASDREVRVMRAALEAEHHVTDVSVDEELTATMYVEADALDYVGGAYFRAAHRGPPAERRPRRSLRGSGLYSPSRRPARPS